MAAHMPLWWRPPLPIHHLITDLSPYHTPSLFTHRTFYPLDHWPLPPHNHLMETLIRPQKTLNEHLWNRRPLSLTHRHKPNTLKHTLAREISSHSCTYTLSLELKKPRNQPSYIFRTLESQILKHLNKNRKETRKQKSKQQEKKN